MSVRALKAATDFQLGEWCRRRPSQGHERALGPDVASAHPAASCTVIGGIPGSAASTAWQLARRHRPVRRQPLDAGVLDRADGAAEPPGGGSAAVDARQLDRAVSRAVDRHRHHGGHHRVAATDSTDQPTITINDPGPSGTGGSVFDQTA
jgi:hypothetical protein